MLLQLPVEPCLCTKQHKSTCSAALILLTTLWDRNGNNPHHGWGYWDTGLRRQGHSLWVVAPGFVLGSLATEPWSDTWLLDDRRMEEWKGGREERRDWGKEGGKDASRFGSKDWRLFFPGLALNQPAMTSEISPWACLALLAPKNLVPWEICDLLFTVCFSPYLQCSHDLRELSVHSSQLPRNPCLALSWRIFWRKHVTVWDCVLRGWCEALCFAHFGPPCSLPSLNSIASLPLVRKAPGTRHLTFCRGPSWPRPNHSNQGGAGVIRDWGGLILCLPLHI